MPQYTDMKELSDEELFDLLATDKKARKSFTCGIK
jgi:hypothetical protein